MHSAKIFNDDEVKLKRELEKEKFDYYMKN